MTKRRVYIDTNIWIKAVQGDSDSAGNAFAWLDSADVQPVISDFILLETQPKPQFHQRREQVDFSITLEKPGKPFFRVPDLHARSIYKANPTP